MSQAYKRMRVRQYPAQDVTDDPEARYWKKFKNPVVTKHFGAIQAVHFSSAEPYDFAVTSSMRVMLHDSKANKVRRSITRFKDTAYSGCYRSDGRLVVAGCKDSTVKVFDEKSKTVLRFYKGHKAPVHVSKFSSDKVHILSGSDDKTVRYWDLSSERPVHVINGAHKDHVRCGANSPTSPSLWATGGYDHVVKLWDMRAAMTGGADGAAAGTDVISTSSGSSCLMSFNHGAPVEEVLMLPGGGAVVSAGGNELKVWDIVSGGKLLHTLSNHQKTITTMCLDGTGTRLLTGSLDQHVKVYSLESFTVMHGMKYSSPVLSMACSPDNSRLVVGMSDGTLDIRQRVVKVGETVARQQQVRAMHGGSYRYFMRGKSSAADASDYKVQVQRKPKLQPYDAFLKKFEHKKALDAALQSRHPVVVVSLLEELVQRDCLVSAVGGRDDVSLQPLLSFLVKYVSHPKYSAVLIDVANVTFDLYASVLGRSLTIDDLFLRMQAAVKRELQFEEELFQLQGCLDLILSSAQ